MRRRVAARSVTGAAVAAALLLASCGPGATSYLKVTLTCDDPLVDPTQLETLTVSWTEGGAQQSVDAPLGDLLIDGSTSFVLKMPGAVEVDDLVADGRGAGGAVLARATLPPTTTRASGTLEVALALGAPPGPRPLQCAGGAAPVMGPVVPVTQAGGSSRTGDAAWTGDGWVVGFDDARFDPQRGSGTDAMIALLAADGTKLGDEIPIDDGWCDAAEVRIAWTGTRILAVWYDCSPSTDGSTYDLMFRALDPNGAPLGVTRALTQAVANDETWRPGTLLWDGDRAVLAAARQVAGGPDWDLVLFLLDEDGGVLEELLGMGSGPMPDSPAPRLAQGDQGYAMVYAGIDHDMAHGSLRRLSSAGHGIDPVVDLGPGSEVGVAWMGDHYVGAALDPSGAAPTLRLVPVGTDGVVGDPLLVTAPAATPLRLAADASELGALVPAGTAAAPGLGFGRLAAWLAPVGAVTPLADAAALPTRFALGARPDGFGAAWTDASSGADEVYFAAFGCSQ